jgi:tRNA(fMet)-specific endonuclease VapC
LSYLLDTNTVIALLNDARSPAATRVRRCRPDEVALCALVIHELFYGAFKSQRTAQNVARVDALQFGNAGEGRRLAGHARRSFSHSALQ